MVHSTELQSVRIHNKILEMVTELWQKCQLILRLPWVAVDSDEEDCA